MKDNPRVGIYVRVSSEERAKEGYSIPAQTRKLESYCDSQNWKERTLYVDPGHSAKDMNRPKFQKLRKDITDGKIDILLVYRLDRMTRSVQDLFEILNFLEENDCGFRSSTENYDTTTAMGRMFIGIVGLLAQWERENLGERVKMGMFEKIVEKGEASGIQPYGYKIENKLRVIDKSESEVVKLIIELYKKYRSALSVAQELNKLKIPTRNRKRGWSHQAVRQVLRNPALGGTRIYDGHIEENAFPGIITKEESDELIALVNKQNIIRLSAPTRGLFSGILKCPNCPATLVKSGNTYRCNKCNEENREFMRVNQKLILDAFKKHVAELKLTPEDNHELKTPTRNIKSEIKSVENKRLKYHQMYADDFMTYDELKIHIKETDEELEKLKKEQNEVKSEIINYEDVKQFQWMLADQFEKLTTEEAIDFMMLFVKEIKFKRKCVKRDKNNNPKKYEYTVTSVKLYGL